MTRMAKLMADRRNRRLAMAREAVERRLCEAHRAGLTITPVGSFARGDFRAHSDIDLLVRGTADTAGRSLAERLAARSLRDSRIPYDLIFESDLTEDRVEALLRDTLRRPLRGFAPGHAASAEQNPCPDR